MPENAVILENYTAKPELLAKWARKGTNQWKGGRKKYNIHSTQLSFAFWATEERLKAGRQDRCSRPGKGIPHENIQLCFNFDPTEPPILPDFEMSMDGGHKFEEGKQTLNPAITVQNRINYHIINDNLGITGVKTKFLHNIEAIRTLKAIEGENRLATPQEQEILSRYVGWGGLSQAFDEHNQSWAREYVKLKDLLNDKEYNAVRCSTLNAHYTSPIIARAIYETLARMGFSKGNILEPSCGIGNFFGVLPESMGR